MTAQETSVLSCGGCGARWFPEAPGRAAELRQCPSCHEEVRVAVFPTLERRREVVESQPVVMAAEAACFFHSSRRAVVACDQCGRFLCALCDLEMGGRHLCPGCLESAEQGAKVEALERRRARHDHIVLALLIAPWMACGFLLPLSATVALWWITRHWRSVPSLVDRSRLRMALCIPVALGELAFGAWFWFMLLTS